MTSYNATITTGLLDDDAIDSLVAVLADYHGALTSPRIGETQIILTYPADNALQAVQTASAVAALHGIEVEALKVETTERFDRLAEEIVVPPLVGVTEAAQILGVSPQAVRYRLASGSLQGMRVGDSWAIPRAAVR